MGFFERCQKDEVRIYSPVDGRSAKLCEVGDVRFGESMMGDGIAVYPADGRMAAPCNGRVEMISYTKHIIGLRTDLGYELMIHIGLRTAKLDGEGIKLWIEEGDMIKKGQRIADIDLELFHRQQIDPVIICVFTNLPRRVNVKGINCRVVRAGELIMNLEITGSTIPL